MHAVLFQTHLLAVAIEQIHVIVTDFCIFEVQTNYIPCLGLREQRPLHCLAGHPLIANGTSWLDICTANIWPDVPCLLAKFRGTQREILRKRPKNKNKAWTKLSEVILKSIIGDCWEKFPHSQQGLMEEFPASKLHLQPATWLTRKFPCRHMSINHWPVWVWS